jgi:hypothetical protein
VLQTVLSCHRSVYLYGRRGEDVEGEVTLATTALLRLFFLLTKGISLCLEIAPLNLTAGFLEMK